MQNIRKALFLLDAKEARIRGLEETILSQGEGLMIKDSIIGHYKKTHQVESTTIALQGLQLEACREDALSTKRKIKILTWIAVGIGIITVVVK